MPSPPPDPKQYQGKPFRGYLNDLVAWLLRSRVVVDPGSGLTASETPGGTSLRATGGSGGAAAWYVAGSGGIDARSDGDVYAQNDTEQERPIRVHNEWYSDCPANRLVCVMAGKIINWDCVDVPPPPEA